MKICEICQTEPPLQTNGWNLRFLSVIELLLGVELRGRKHCRENICLRVPFMMPIHNERGFKWGEWKPLEGWLLTFVGTYFQVFYYFQIVCYKPLKLSFLNFRVFLWMIFLHLTERSVFFAYIFQIVLNFLLYPSPEIKAFFSSYSNVNVFTGSWYLKHTNDLQFQKPKVRHSPTLWSNSKVS